MTSSENSSTIKARDTLSLHIPVECSIASNDKDVLKPTGRTSFDVRTKKGLSRPKIPHTNGTLSCRSLCSDSSRKELKKHINTFNLQIVSIQEHRFIHQVEDPEVNARHVGQSILFITSASRNNDGAAIGGVGFTVKKHMLPLLTKVMRINSRNAMAVFTSNPKTVFICCYSPHNQLPEEEVEQFYHQLNVTVLEIPSHNMLFIAGDFNARIKSKFSYHQNTNRNGEFLEEFLYSHNLVAGNTTFKKPKRKLWT